MEYLLERFRRNVQEAPNQPFFYDDAHRNGITFAEFDDLSARVYAWLKGRGIGREDFVLIHLPRGAMPFAAAAGVWKAGAAFVIVEENYAPERIAFIRRDCGCRAELDRETFEEALHTAPLPGYEKTDPHDAAFAVYTSGTTGEPKGVLHEYGNLERSVQSMQIEGNVMFRKGIFRPYASPLGFVAAIIGLIAMLWADHARMYIVSYSTAKDPEAFERLFREYGFNMLFLPPSYARVLGPRLAPYLKLLVLASEPANGFFIPGLDIRNFYGSSETLFLVGTYRIDRAYDLAPVGKPSFPLEVRLLDEDGNEVPEGEIGEITFETPYLRGYINRPEETAEVFRGGVFHLGDLARRDAEGNLLVVGRANDMVKINGNRVEPAEIENVFKRLTGVDWAAARAFAEEDGRGFVCVYTTAAIDFDAAALRHRMAEFLPYYMIPSHFIHIDEIPLRPNGKLDRKALPAPRAREARRDYAAPADETEEKLCRGFEEVLGLDRVGAGDDFYELGGDSLRGIELVMHSGLPGLNAGIVFRGRTPRGIAALYRKEAGGEAGRSPEEANREAMMRPHPLTTEQIFMMDVQFYTPNSTMYNLFLMLQADRGYLDPEKLAEALGTVIQGHPALTTLLFFNEDGEVLQRYAPELFGPVSVERCTEAEFQALKDDLVQPFRIIGNRLYRCRVFETETHVYLFFDVHHILFDGGSYRVLLEDIARVYRGGAAGPDRYYLMLARRERERRSDFYQESRRYFKETYDGDDWEIYPKLDHLQRDNRLGEAHFPLTLTADRLQAAEAALGVGRNELMIGAALAAVAAYNGSDHIKLSWIYSGRDEKEMLSTVGLLFRELPVALRFEGCAALSDLYDQVRRQVRAAIEHSCYPYVNEALSATVGSSACVLYQNFLTQPIAIGDVQMVPVDVRQNRDASQAMLDIKLLERREGLELGLDYIATLYEAESMERFGGMLMRILYAIVRAAEAGEDLPIAELMERARRE